MSKISLISFILLCCATLPLLSQDIVSLQPYKKFMELPYKDGEGKDGVTVLINLNVNVNVWYLLEVDRTAVAGKTTFHLENLRPEQTLELNAKVPIGIEIKSKDSSYFCNFSDYNLLKAIEESQARNNPYTEACEGRIYIRNFTEGRQSAKERITDFLRDHVWGGEAITSFVKNTLYKDGYLIDTASKSTTDATVAELTQIRHLPRSADLTDDYKNTTLEPIELGIPMADKAKEAMMAGQWYETKSNKGIYISLIQAKMVNERYLKSFKDHVSDLDSVEEKALTYLVAFDLSRYRLGFMLGTKHPSVEWSERINEKMVDKKLAGPDEIGDTIPLIRTGQIPPKLAKKIVATFTGGFKRSHGAFRWGNLAEVNHGSHYGFIEYGVVFSRLQPSLATIVIDTNDRLYFKTWTDADNSSLLPTIKHARQNGVAIIDGIDSSTMLSVPGKLVNKWGPGNWSGSIDSKQRALRAAICTQLFEGREYLIYGYFSTATPNAVARVFQSYNCNYAMHLDMNALEHTYLTVYQTKFSKLEVQNLIQGMSVLDSKFQDQIIPRFIGMADIRDFFYIMRRD